MTVSGISYVLAGFLAHNGLPGVIALPVGMAIMIGYLFFLRARHGAEN